MRIWNWMLFLTHVLYKIHQPFSVLFCLIADFALVIILSLSLFLSSSLSSSYHQSINTIKQSEDKQQKQTQWGYISHKFLHSKADSRVQREPMEWSIHLQTYVDGGHSFVSQSPTPE